MNQVMDIMEYLNKSRKLVGYRARAKELKITLRRAVFAKRLQTHGVTRWFESCAINGMNEARREIYDLYYSDCDAIINNIKTGRSELAVMLLQYRKDRKELRKAIALSKAIES